MKYWPEISSSHGFLVWRYLLRRDDVEPAPWTSEGIERSRRLCLRLQVRLRLSRLHVYSLKRMPVYYLCALILDITHSSWSVDCKGWGMRSHKYRKGKEVKKQPPRYQTALRPRIVLGENWAWQWKGKYIWPLNTTGLTYLGPLTHRFFSVANTVVHFCCWLNPQMQRANHKVHRNFWLLYNWPNPNFLHCLRVNCISNSLWTLSMRERDTWNWGIGGLRREVLS